MYLNEVVKEQQRCLHNSRVLVAKRATEVVLEMGHQVWREEEELVHRHDSLLTNQLPVNRTIVSTNETKYKCNSTHSLVPGSLRTYAVFPQYSGTPL